MIEPSENKELINRLKVVEEVLTYTCRACDKDLPVGVGLLQEWKRFCGSFCREYVTNRQKLNQLCEALDADLCIQCRHSSTQEEYCTRCIQLIKSKVTPTKSAPSNKLLLMGLVALVGLMLLVCHVRAQDMEFERVCRSPKSYNLSAPIYEHVAEVMNTTPTILHQVALLKVENYTHIERVFLGSYHKISNEDNFVRSKTILSSEILRVLHRNTVAWSEICSD